MKPSLLLLAALLGAFSVQAKCYTNGLVFWPISKTIRQKAIFVIDGYDASQDIIKGLGSRYQVYLKSGAERVPLRVQETLVGQYNVTQAVLTPQFNLIIGKQYELVIEEPRYKGQNIARSFARSNSGSLLYTVVAGTDTAAPTWKVLPQEKAKYYTEMGCGPEVAVEFFGAAHDQSAYLIKATVKDLATGKATSYYLRPSTANVIEVGHGMCAGPFALEKGKNFSVVFALMDASGNTTNWTGKAIPFTAPVISG